MGKYRGPGPLSQLPAVCCPRCQELFVTNSYMTEVLRLGPWPQANVITITAPTSANEAFYGQTLNSSLLWTGQRDENMERRQDSQRRGEADGVSSRGSQQQISPGSI